MWVGFFVLGDYLRNIRIKKNNSYWKRFISRGRLQSVPFGNEEIYTELGGMRTFPGGVDRYLSIVLKQLKIKTIEEPYNEPDNIAYVRRTRMDYGVVDSPCKNTIQRRELIALYNLPSREYTISINDLITNVAEKADPNYQTNYLGVLKIID